ncbi:MAG: tRNA (N6-threonylcarbamoyladenosine(37)-N6)-methyltransferase TrmO [Pseudomonadota bacterium]
MRSRPVRGLPDDAAQLAVRPIGHMRTSFATKVEAPRQPAASAHTPGIIELLPGQNLEHAIEDLVGWERIWVIFWFDRNEGWRPKVLPPRSTDGRKGVLATRAPHRPNPLGLSVLRLERVEGLNLHVLDVDLLDGTPVLDIKPYVPYTDAFPESGSGWLRPAVDPGKSWSVCFTTEAEAQLAWIAARSPRPLRERIVNTLMLGPQPHPYRRIKHGKDGSMRLAVQDWRATFRIDDSMLTVIGIYSGYSKARMAQHLPDPDGTLQLHREFGIAFG